MRNHLFTLHAVLLVLLLANNSLADGNQNETQGRAVINNQDKSSANMNKTAQDFLPGEEVRTSTGKTAKVWSTRGPVSVSPAPEPFEDRDTDLLVTPYVNVDAIKRRHGGGSEDHHGDHHDRY